MQSKNFYVTVIIILCIVLLRGLIYGLVIPFDQAPDEKHHFLQIKAKQMQLKGASKEERQEVAAHIEATWLQLLYVDTPEERFTWEQFKGSNLPTPPSSQQLYYLVTATILRLCSLEEIRNEIYLLRGLSVLCGVVIVGLAILISRELFPSARFLQFGIPIFIAFVPQFSAMNGVISNDKLAEVFATLLFWILIRIFKQGISWQYGLAYLLTIALALLSKRTTYFLLPFSLLAAFLYCWKKRLGVRMHLYLFGAMLLVAGIGYGLLWLPGVYSWVHDHIISIPDARRLPKAIFRPELFTAATLLYIAKFFTVMYWGFWGIFGYMTIHVHHFWYVAAACAQMVAIAGLVKYVIQAQQQKIVLKAWQANVLYLFGASVVFALLIPVLRSIILKFDAPDLTQGRYLFTIMVPIGTLTLFGLSALFPPKYHRWVGGIGLGALCLLDAIVIVKYLFLNFHHATLF